MAEIVYGHINDQGQLVILLSDDRVLNVGRVVGPPGPTGNQGRPGVPGPAGTDGAEIFLTAGPPDPAQGKPGDIAIDIRAWKLYQKSGMGWGMGNDMMPGAKNLDAATRRFNSGGGSGGGRFFGMGAPSAGIAGTPASTGDGLDPIYGHNKPLPPSLTTLIASDTKGDAMHVIVKADSTTGSWYGEIIVTHFGGVSDHAVAWEVPIAGAPTLTFTTRYNVDHLELSVSSDQLLTNLRGKVIYV
jgi:hypothetical protein